METKANNQIKISTHVNAPLSQVWECWTKPEHISQWYFASDDWHAPHAKNVLQPGGRFLTRMEAKDGSMGFDFSGKYTDVMLHKEIKYVLDDDRKVVTLFSEKENGTEVTQIFDAESSHSFEMQQQGWQNILENFKKYVEKGIQLLY